MIDLEDIITKQRILVVDDCPENIQVLNEILEPYYKVDIAHNCSQALKNVSAADKPDMILLKTSLPDIDGYRICRQLKAMPETSQIPVIFVSTTRNVEDEKEGFSLGAVDYITTPLSLPIILARVSAHLKLADQKSHLMTLVKERSSALSRTRMEILQILGRAAEFKDNETGMHVIRISWYCRFLAKRCTGNNGWSELLFNAAPMHDIGKIAIPDEVLLKPGRLDQHEWQVMKKHVDFGVQILGEHESDLLQMAVEVIQNHHEKWDGTGYPAGLSGEDIPLSARIVAIADVFDALTSDRPHKKAWSVEKSIALIESESGKHFDPQLVPLFAACLPKMLQIKEQYQDE
ncbi:HD domain-containing phosphohydrolase [Psychromonas aquimarina]|uniref:HD domain-containing phosphohydrolase n=1 Tax=Psychromonas aquimarina TaxID=444919 RepID=UPI0004175CFE|nr:HD domain-containing phosphohydrolase [Psychromonas aquimarina]